MTKRILSMAMLVALALPVTASALPRSMPAFDVQMDICREGLEMIIDGASDEEEQKMLERRLGEYGWKEEGDLEDIMLLCSFYKQGYLYAMRQ